VLEGAAKAKLLPAMGWPCQRGPSDATLHSSRQLLRGRVAVCGLPVQAEGSHRSAATDFAESRPVPEFVQSGVGHSRPEALH
jgi:hypothetical protein